MHRTNQSRHPEALKEIDGVSRDSHTRDPKAFLLHVFALPRTTDIAAGNALGVTRLLRSQFLVVAAAIPLLTILVLWRLFFMPASNTSLPLIMPIFQALLPAFGKHEEHRSPGCLARSVLVVKQTTVRMVSAQSGGDRRENKMSTARLLESKMMDGRKKIF